MDKMQCSLCNHEFTQGKTVALGDGMERKGCPECEHDDHFIGGVEFSFTPRKVGYEKRSDEQLKKWLDGESVCNKIDGECCPDFSCCKPQMKQPTEVRRTFFHASEEVREQMLLSFFSASLASHPKVNEIYISGQEDVKNN